MRRSFDCGHCATTVDVPEYVRARFDEPTQCRCSRCGAAHNFLRGEYDLVSPPMFPCDTPGRVSPWMLHKWRPVHAGWYELRFMDVEGTLFLWWNGRYFQPAPDDERSVRMATLSGWRGTWGESR